MKCPALVGRLKDFARRRFHFCLPSLLLLSSGAVSSMWYFPKVASWAAGQQFGPAFPVSNTRIKNGADPETARIISGLEDGNCGGFVRWRASVRRFSGPLKFPALQAAE